MTQKSLLLSLRNVYETLAVSAPTVVDALRGQVTKKLCDDRIETWSSRVVANCEMLISVQGREHVPCDTTYLVMSNHQSHYDIVVLYYVLGSTLRMVAKRELFELPVFGGALRAAGFIAIDRTNLDAARAGLTDAKSQLENGTPMWIAPEGTRSPTGELLPFKKGGFAIALETNTPILPVTIRGTRDVLRAKGVRSTSGVEVFVTIHPTVNPRDYAHMDPKAARDALADNVRRSIASGL
ncbi:MAG TPA: lysophospholipid acyltransferase family protein [Labilithrix sp.]|nr:lysophospholipid acyltransferase family protein [Labilithrix sp.]